MTRRGLFHIPPALLAAAAAPTRTTGGIAFNEDNSHYFFSRAGQRLDAETVASFVDQYAGTQVREFILSANSQRTSFASKAWDPIWKGYDPSGPDDQPLFASTPKEGRAGARKWVHTAWRLHQQGIDPYELWIRRAREKKLSPWISMRMNDLHNVDDPASYMHSTFWREHPDLLRFPWRVPTPGAPAADWRERAFDFQHQQVRDYHFKLIEEYCERYDFDGLELDWMRFGFHFKPGLEQQGGEVLNDFMRRTRSLLNGWEKKRGHPIKLGARVPSRPQTAWAMGLDGALWAKEGTVQMLVITPFWASVETDMPVELWRRLVGDNVTLAAGLELLIRPYHDYRKIQKNSLETVRGAAASLLSRGADRIYLFNYMDADTAIEDLSSMPALLRECGSLQTLAGKPRRHVVTYSDTWAPGEQQGSQLPKTIRAGGSGVFRLHTGPALRNAKVRLEIEGITDPAKVRIRVNGGDAILPLLGEAQVDKPAPAPTAKNWLWDLGACQNWIALEVSLPEGGKVHWVEILG